MRCLTALSSIWYAAADVLQSADNTGPRSLCRLPRYRFEYILAVSASALSWQRLCATVSLLLGPPITATAVLAPVLLSLRAAQTDHPLNICGVHEDVFAPITSLDIVWVEIILSYPVRKPVLIPLLIGRS